MSTTRKALGRGNPPKGTQLQWLVIALGPKPIYKTPRDPSTPSILRKNSTAYRIRLQGRGSEQSNLGSGALGRFLPETEP